jgi:hypothetical protein
LRIIFLTGDSRSPNRVLLLLLLLLLQTVVVLLLRAK